MKTLGIAVEAWAAWAPAIESHEDWLQWAAGNREPEQDGGPKVTSFKPMYRRRLSRLGKMAAYVLDQCRGGNGKTRLVYASRYGEQQRTEGILDKIIGGDEVSPTAFSLSVHNAIAGLCSIVDQDQAPSVSIAAGKDTFAAAWVEAQCLLSDGECEQVLLVYYDEPLMGPYEAFIDEAIFPMGLALRLRLADEQDELDKVLSLSLGSAPEGTDQPQALAFLRFLLNNELQSEGTGIGSRWVWKRDEVA